ncbi:cyclin-U3 [Salix suchowensis]|nr:cyclin-U3 [Salix suchowensis]
MNQDSQYSLFLSYVLSESASFLTLLYELMGFNSMQLISDMEALSPDTGSTELEIYQTLGLKESRKGVFKIPRVLMLLSSLLERTVQKNEILMEKTEIKDAVTIFHGLKPPPVSIRQYVDRIFKYSACSPSCFVVAHVYVDRFLQQTDIHLTSLNVHRLLITSVMIAAKFVDDSRRSKHRRIEQVGMKFLFGIDFRLQVNVNTFGKYCYACRIKESWSSKEDSPLVLPR